MRNLGIFLALVILVQGCSSMDLSHFENRSPKLDLFEYFEGRTTAWGWIEDRFGNVRRQFRVDIQGTVKNNQLTLNEEFLYDDGEKQTRIWTISKTDDHSYKGVADDIIGTATGLTRGNALNWNYRMRLPIGDSMWEVSFDDWMFLQEGGVLLNRAEISKFGLNIAKVSIFFKKQKDGP